jgi:nucleoside-diphosphate-sugar epimerase
VGVFYRHDMILVIGGMGFIGLNTALRLLEVGKKVVITQHTSHRVPDIEEHELTFGGAKRRRP